jgi:thiamine biosynthesis lipoprotein
MRRILIPSDIDPALPPAGSILHQAAGSTMGTSWSVRMMLARGAGAGLADALQRELDEVVAQMSHWEPDSLLARYNAAPAGSWHELPPQFFAVMDYALELAAATGGAYDPGAGELVNLWGFGPVRRFDQAGFYAPQAGAVADVLASLAARRAAASLVLDRAGRRLLQPGGVRLDLSSIAKGHAVDRLAHCIEQHGVLHYLAEIGGELRGAGMKPDGQPWWVELEGVPGTASQGGQVLVALHGLAAATSGDYRRSYQHGARRASHTLDPRSGYPIANDVASVTVLHASCMAADALSTALTVMGLDAGLAFAEARGLAARYLVRGQAGLHEHTSGAWRAMLG